MRHILFFTDTPLSGGAEQQMYLLAKFLDRQKYRVSLACLTSPGLNTVCQKFLDEGFSVFRLPVSYKNDPRIFSLLKKIIQREHVDLIHLHLWNPASGRFALLASRASKKPYIITEHDPFQLSFLKNFVKKHMIGRPHGVIALSRENEIALRAMYNARPQKFYQISNGIDIELWIAEISRISEKDRDEFREKEFKASPEDPVFINVATLHERKGQHVLIQAFANFLKSAPEEWKQSKLVLVGEGPAKRSYQHLAEDLEISDSVKFLGQRKDIARLLTAADIYVHPSVREAFGLAILEAGIASLPVIASNVGGIPDIIHHGENGILVPPSKPWELAEAMKKVIEDIDLRKRIAKNLQTRILEGFGAKIMAKKTEEVYDNILHGEAIG